jgi:hypothetical protein
MDYPLDTYPLVYINEIYYLEKSHFRMKNIKIVEDNQFSKIL